MSTYEQQQTPATVWRRAATAGICPWRRTYRLSTGPARLAGIAAILVLVVVCVPLLVTLSAAQPGAASPGTAILRVAPAGQRGSGARGAPATSDPSSSGATSLVAAAQVTEVDSLIAHMTLDEEIGQMVMVGFLETSISPALQAEISQYHVGSVVLYAWNMHSGPQVKQLVQQLQAAAGMPLLVATDQEGGDVNRLLTIAGPLPSAAQIGATNDPAYARQRGAQDAQALAALGININFAPVVDVQNVPNGEGDLTGRMFGSTPQQVITMAGAYLGGLQQSHQVAGTLKHFPGLGDVPTDPHQTLYMLNRSLADLEQVDWAPYKALIATGQVNMIMTTHVIDAAVDPSAPASLSHAVVTGILRDQLGYTGVIVTDGIYMQALWGTYPTMNQVFLAAVEAGNDIICSTWSIDSTAQFEQTIHDAVMNGALTKQRIDDSVRRILLLKLRLGLLSAPPTVSGWQ